MATIVTVGNASIELPEDIDAILEYLPIDNIVEIEEEVRRITWNALAERIVVIIHDAEEMDTFASVYNITHDAAQKLLGDILSDVRTLILQKIRPEEGRKFSVFNRIADK